jgi:hypothetical protein
MAAGPVVYLRQRRPWVPGEGRPLLQHQDCRATEDAAQQCNQDPSSRARRSRGDGIHVGRDARFRAGCWLRPPAEQHRPQRELFYPEPGSRLRRISPASNADQAIICTDIYASWTAASVTSSGRFDVWGTGEYYCQGASQQCKGMNVKNSLAIWAYATQTPEGPVSGPIFPDSPTDTESSNSYTCSTTSCPITTSASTRVYVSTTHYTGIVPFGGSARNRE